MGLGSREGGAFRVEDRLQESWVREQCTRTQVGCVRRLGWRLGLELGLGSRLKV